MCDPTQNIIIDKIHGPSEGLDLMGNFFRWVTEIDGFNYYDLYGKDEEGKDKLIISNLRVGMVFNFVLPQFLDIVWVLNITASSCTFVAGNWSGFPIGTPIDDVVPEPDQSYQAQAGVTPVYEESAVAATATA